VGGGAPEEKKRGILCRGLGAAYSRGQAGLGAGFEGKKKFILWQRNPRRERRKNHFHGESGAVCGGGSIRGTPIESA